MKNITEFLKECRVDGNEKIDTNDDSFWKLKDLLEHYKEQCNIPVVSQQRELLLGYNDYLEEMYNAKCLEPIDVDDYLKTK